MVFTNEEEEILKLMINELRTRKLLDKKRAEKDAEYRNAIKPINTEINNSHKAEFDALQSDYNQAEKDIEDKF